MLFEPKHDQAAGSPFFFTSKKNWIAFQCWVNKFLESCLIHETLWWYTEGFGKSISYYFLSTTEQHPTDFYSRSNRSRFNPLNVLRIGLHDHLLNIAPLFAPHCSADIVIARFGCHCYILTQCGIYFSTFLFIQLVFIFFLKLYKFKSSNFRLYGNTTILIVLAHVFLLKPYHTCSLIYILLNETNVN